MYNIIHSLTIKCSAQTLWEGVTSAELLDKWWTTRSSGAPSLGSEYMFWFSDEYDWRALVKESKALELIIYKMIRADSDWTGTELVFEITANQDDSACHLCFSHRGWKHINEHYSRTSYCWALYLKKLKDVMEERKKI